MQINLDTPRLRGRVVVAAVLLMSLAGCGGSSGGGGSPPTGPDSGPANESTFWLAGLTKRQGQISVTTWDPAGASQTLRSFAADASPLLSAPARAYDPVARTRTELGLAMSFFLQNGHVMRLDLRGGQPHDPVQVSDVANACSLREVHPMNAEASVSLVAITRTDTNGGCSITALVRSDMSATAAAPSMDGKRLLGTLADDLGEVSALLIAVPSVSGGGEWLRALDRNLNSLGPVGTEDSGGQDAALLAFDPAQAGLAYVALGGEVRKLRWSGVTITLDAGSMRQLAASPATWLPPGAIALPHDNDQLYLVDGGQILNLRDGGAVLLGSVDAGETIDQLLIARDRLVLHSDVDYLYHYVKSLPKAGGAITVLASGQLTQGVGLLGVASDWVVLARSSESGSSYHRISPDGGSTDDLAGTPAGAIRAVTTPLGVAPALQSVLLCQGSGQAPQPCGTGELIQVDVGTLGSLSLGPTNFQAALIDFNGFSGLSGAFAAATADGAQVDAMVATPGQARSISRITRNLP